MHFIIDTSYTVFYRFHALKIWGGHALKELDGDKLLEAITEKFQEKFISSTIDVCKKAFRERSLESTTKNSKKTKRPLFKMQDHTFWWCRDASREDLWRMELFPDYKSTRECDSGVGQYFKMGYKLLETFVEQHPNHRMLRHPRLEGDDVVYLVTQHLVSRKESDDEKQPDINIISSDHDLLQIQGLARQKGQIQFWNCKKGGTYWDSPTGEWEKDLMRKIIGGDKSDNIPSCLKRIAKKTVDSYVENPSLLEERLLSWDETARKTFEINRQIIDFRHIPTQFSDEVQTMIEQCEKCEKYKKCESTESVKV